MVLSQQIEPHVPVWARWSVNEFVCVRVCPARKSECACEREGGRESARTRKREQVREKELAHLVERERETERVCIMMYVKY